MPRVQGTLPEPKLGLNWWKDPELKPWLSYWPLVDVSLLKRGENRVNLFSFFKKVIFYSGLGFFDMKRT